MNPRKLLVFTLALGIFVAPLAADAQQQGKVTRLGLLVPGTASSFAHRIEPFRQQLRELGYVEARNIFIEYRYAEGRAERFPDLAAELVRLKVDIIVTWGTPASRAAKQATSTIPIVMANVGDAVGAGLVASLARPGGNITGSSYLFPEIVAKRFELLKETLPVTRVAVLVNPANPVHGLVLKEIEVAARVLALELQHVEVRDPNEFDRAFSAMTKKRADALVVLDDGMFVHHRARIANLALKSRLPTMYGLREEVEAGGLMAYGVNLPDLARRAAVFVDKILKGAKPVDLPVEQPTRFELVVNLKTAKALGLTIPPSVLIRADEVIQ